jgi:hypothetical protein
MAFQINKNLFIIILISISTVGLCFKQAYTKEKNILRDGSHDLAFETSMTALHDEGFKIHCRLKNISNKKLSILLIPHINVETKITSSSGETKNMQSTLLFRIQVSKNDILLLEAAESHEFDLELTKKNYSWPQSGTYKMQLAYSNSRTKVDGISVWTGQVESNTFPVSFQ